MDEKKLKREQAAEAAYFSRIGSRLIGGARLVVQWLFPPSKEIGYTSDGTPKVVHVTWGGEPFSEKMSDKEVMFFRLGVFAHEVLHQIFTNFRYAHRICDKLTQSEAAIFMHFSNLLEDPAIEYFAPDVMGDKLLSAIKYVNATLYTHGASVSDASDAFEQLCNALCCFGICGLVKGEFTFPEAKEAFAKVAPLYNRGITCPDSRERVDIAKECMEMTRPLWEEHIKKEEAWKKLLEELLKSHEMNCCPTADEGKLKGSKGDKKSKARSKTLSDMSEKADKDDKDGESGSSADSDASDTEEDNGNSEASDGSANAAPGDPTATDGKANDGEVAEMLNEDLVIDDEMLDGILSKIKKESEAIQKAEESSAKSSSEEIENFDISSRYIKGSSCSNTRVKSGSKRINSEYAEYVRNYSWDIKVLTKALKNLFAAEKEENIRATSGSYNIKRGSIGCTARIMDKTREPGNKKDVCVFLAVDLSGSMACSDRIGQARKASIVFAESLSKLGIPYYIMGYHADRKADADHEHYVTWNGKGKETLATMHADANNFDGYSIRYAAEVIKKRPESKKLLFVISDGEPACYSYKNFNDGVTDTRQAVKDANKVATVFGIALGNGCDPEILQSFYGNDFIHCKDEKLLAATLSKKLVKQLKK